MKSVKLNINLVKRKCNYPIYINQNLEYILLEKFLVNHQTLLITDQNIYNLHSKIISKVLELTKPSKSEILIINQGEVNKSLATIEKILSKLAKLNFTRNSNLIAFGGGLIGDLTGFAASIFKRGVNFIQIPTTLLAQVDASIGGKTGINFYQTKNLIGSFYQPKLVFITTNFLKTLPERELKSGFAEILKIALISDLKLWNKLSIFNNCQEFIDSVDLINIIKHSCNLKAKIIEKDEMEQSVRALLNFGHSFGHAIESIYDKQQYLHGEAITVGMLMAGYLSFYMGKLSFTEFNEMKNLFIKLNLTTVIKSNKPHRTCNEIKQLMLRDKKNQTNNYCLILLNKIGQAFIDDYTDSVSKLNNSILKFIELC